MATPSDLVSHYSSLAFRTRIYALTFAGAVLAAVIKWPNQEEQTNLIGLALIAVVGSLGELNRRYTHSYLAACRVSALEAPWRSDEAATANRWRIFYAINEWPWSTETSSIFRLSRKGATNRFLLSWLTYLPGLLVGVIIIFRGKISTLGWAGIGIAALFLRSWFNRARYELDPDKMQRKVNELLRPDPGE